MLDKSVLCPVLLPLFHCTSFALPLWGSAQPMLKLQIDLIHSLEKPQRAQGNYKAPAHEAFAGRYILLGEIVI